MTETHNPKGPATGTEKVMRGLSPNESMTFSGFPHVDRHHENPEKIIFGGSQKKRAPFVDQSFRCVINQPDPVKVN